MLVDSWTHFHFLKSQQSTPLIPTQVDTHIHAASSMNQKHLLRFIKKSLKTDGKEKVGDLQPKITI